MGTINNTISDNADWLIVEPTSGISIGEIIKHSVSEEKKGLVSKNENYSATITVICSDAYNNPKKASVTLKI